LYQSSNKILSCTKPEQYVLGGAGNDNKDVCIPPNAPTEDPLSMANDWAYKMINVLPVWNNLKYTGKGIHIRINDDGVDVDNKEFNDGVGFNGVGPKFDQAASCEQWKPLPGSGKGHGTAVAGIAVANANNDHCAAGIAYNSAFSSCNFFVPQVPFTLLTYKLQSFDISQNSIGSPYVKN